MNWKYIVISLSFGIGFLIGRSPSFENLRTYTEGIVVPAILGGGGIAVVFKFWDLAEKLNREKEKTKLDYSRKLVDNVLIPRAATEIGFDTQNDYNLDIKIIGLPITPEYKRYSNDADVCLKEYKNIQKIIKDINIRIAKHNAISQAFLNKLTSDILSNIKQGIPIEWDSSNPIDSKKYILRNNIESDLIKANRSNYRTYEPISLSISGTILTYSRSGNKWIESDDENELKELKEMIETKFDVAIKSPDFIQLKNCFKHIKEDLHEDYKKEIDEIIINTIEDFD